MNTFERFCNEYSYYELKGISNHYYDRFKDTLEKMIDRDDYFQTMCIKLYSDDNYDSSKAKLRTYVNVIFDYYTLTLIRNLKAKKRMVNYDTVSMEKTIDTGENITIGDMIESEHGINEEEIYLNQCIEKICELIPKEKQRKIFKLHMQGYSFKEIADKLGLNIRQVNSSFQTTKNRLKRMEYAVINILYC